MRTDAGMMNVGLMGDHFDPAEDDTVPRQRPSF